MVFSKLFGQGGLAGFPPPRPDMPVDIVGDLHGRADLFDALPIPEPHRPRVFVGDVIDRGPDSRGVIARLQAHEQKGNGVCLMGNHEKMMLNFLDDPVRAAPVWLRNGGVQTLESFGVLLDDPEPEPAAREQARDAFRKALGAETEAWLRARPLSWRSGTLFVAHAGADPGVSLEKQSERALLWGSRKFATTPRRDKIWVAHGHTIFDSPHAEHGRIAVDTGAYATGRLSMARVETDGQISFVMATAQ